MEVYKFKNLDNGDILLEKTILNNDDYIIKTKKNGDILLKKITSVDIKDVEELKKYDFTKSKISSCKIGTKNALKLKFKSILNDIYKIINDGTRIIKNTKLNVKTVEKQDDGFYYIKDLHISVQGVDSDKCLFEITNQCIKNKIPLNMKITLHDGKNINVKFK